MRTGTTVLVYARPHLTSFGINSSNLLGTLNDNAICAQICTLHTLREWTGMLQWRLLQRGATTRVCNHTATADAQFDTRDLRRVYLQCTNVCTTTPGPERSCSSMSKSVHRLSHSNKKTQNWPTHCCERICSSMNKSFPGLPLQQKPQTWAQILAGMDSQMV